MSVIHWHSYVKFAQVLFYLVPNYYFLFKYCYGVEFNEPKYQIHVKQLYSS